MTCCVHWIGTCQYRSFASCQDIFIDMNNQYIALNCNANEMYKGSTFLTITIDIEMLIKNSQDVIDR